LLTFFLTKLNASSRINNHAAPSAYRSRSLITTAAEKLVNAAKSPN
jgi:hypothetical protein